MPSYAAMSAAAITVATTLIPLASASLHASYSELTRISNHCSPSGHIKDACCEYSDVNHINDQISPLLQDLVQTSFFRYYKVNLEKGCPFWKEDHRCSSIDCAVATVDESEVAEHLKTVAISKVDFSTAGDNGFGLFHSDCEFSENDFCVVEDEVHSEGVYVNLLLNPERFTGYAGESAARIWNALYKENCFPLDDSGSHQLTSDHQRALDNTCTEKRVFYRLISGLHTSISTHICDKYLDRKTGIWYRNLDCFLDRVGRFPERVENLYFTYVVLLRAVTKLSPYLKTYSWCAGVEGDKGKIKSLVRDIVKVTKSCPPAFDEKQLFADSSSDVIKEEFKMHFRNISRIMDCVGCEKCRLWGKLQISGLGTALKILFSFGNKASSYQLTRSELVALINGFTRVSNSMSAIARFRAMMEQEMRATPLDSIDGKDLLDESIQSQSSRSGQPNLPTPEVPNDTKAPEVEPTADPRITAFSKDAMLLDLSYINFFEPRRFGVWLIGLVLMVYGSFSVCHKAYQWHNGTMKVPTEGYGRITEEQEPQEGDQSSGGISAASGGGDGASSSTRPESGFSTGPRRRGGKKKVPHLDK